MAAPDNDARAWARKVLGMSAGDDARFALLRKVKAFDFHPGSDVGAAFHAASRPGLAPADLERLAEWGGCGYERDQRRREAVEAFADEFFKLPPAERVARFQAMVVGADPILEARLARLGRAMDIDFDRPGLAADEQQVVSILHELFPMAPDERAPRRRQLLDEVRRTRPFDRATLDRLAASWPSMARLEPELWRQLEWAVSTQPVRRATPVVERPPAPAPAPEVTRPAPRESLGNWWQFIWIAVVLSGVISGAISGTRNRDNVNPRPDFDQRRRREEVDAKKQREFVDEILRQRGPKGDLDPK